MNEKGIKHDKDKDPIDLVPSEAIIQIAKVLGFGARKYDRQNWRKGIAYSRLIAAALRHILAFNAGESKDPESGLSHISHASCCLAFLLEFEKTQPSLDDRYKAQTKEESNVGTGPEAQEKEDLGHLYVGLSYKEAVAKNATSTCTCGVPNCSGSWAV